MVAPKPTEGASEVLGLVLRRIADVPAGRFRGWILNCAGAGRLAGTSLSEMTSKLAKPIVVTAAREKDGEVEIECFTAAPNISQFTLNGIPTPDPAAARRSMIEAEVDDLRVLARGRAPSLVQIRVLLRWRSESVVVTLDDYGTWLSDYVVNGGFGISFDIADADATSKGAQIVGELR